MHRIARTVFLVQDLNFGGTQRQALELAARLDSARFRVQVWALAAGDDLVPLARDLGVPMRWLGRDGFVHPLTLWRLWAALRRERPDLLLCLTALPNIWGRVLGRLAGVPAVVGSCRGGGAISRQHERLLWKLAHRHICNSAALTQTLQDRFGVPARRVAHIPNGVDVAFFAPGEPGARAPGPVVLCVARLHPDKDHATLLRAFARLHPRRPDARLWLLGDGPMRSRLQALARDILPGDAVEFIPGKADVRPYLRQASVAALSSVREGLPNVVLEAMAAGLPVVATEVGGVPDCVVHGETGLLSPPGDAEALAANLGRLLASFEVREAMGRAGRVRVERDFSYEAMARRHEAVFSELLAGR